MTSAPEIDFRHLLASAPDGILIADHQGRILLTNDHVTTMFGYEPGELAGQPVELLIPEDLREKHAEHRRHYADRPARRPMGINLNLVGRRKNGDEFPVEISLSPTSSNGRLLVTAVIRDVTERKRLEAERERLHGELETERERHRIGMDLHDGIMQAIYAVSLTLELASDDLNSSPEEAKVNVDRAIDQLHGVVRDIRSYIFDLRPRAYAGDLAGAIINLGNEFRQNSLIETMVDIAASLPPVPEKVGVALYQIVHEALSNIRKHAKASSVTISLKERDGCLCLEVRDTGTGFDLAVATPETHRGLRNMTSRALGIGGKLTVDSALGRGTRVSVEWPAPMD